MRAQLLVLLVACSASSEPVPVDAGADAPADSTPDAAPCWKHRAASCGAELYDLCVPYDGCAYFTCDGMAYGYCGPGAS